MMVGRATTLIGEPHEESERARLAAASPCARRASAARRGSSPSTSSRRGRDRRRLRARGRRAQPAREDAVRARAGDRGHDRGAGPRTADPQPGPGDRRRHGVRRRGPPGRARPAHERRRQHHARLARPGQPRAAAAASARSGRRPSRVVEGLGIRTASLDTDGRHAVGRQPAEGRARALVVLGRARAGARRPDARDRRRRQGGGLPARPAARLRGRRRAVPDLGDPRGEGALGPAAGHGRRARSSPRSSRRRRRRRSWPRREASMPDGTARGSRRLVGGRGRRADHPLRAAGGLHHRLGGLPHQEQPAEHPAPVLGAADPGRRADAGDRRAAASTCRWRRRRR